MTQGLRWLRISAISIVVTTVLLALLLTALPGFLKSALNRWLPPLLGSSEHPATLHLDQLSWRHLHLQQLQLNLPDGSQLQLHNLHLNWHLSELLHGRLQNLHLEELHLRLPAPSAEKLAKAAAANAGEAVREQFNQAISIPPFSQWLQLPLQQLQIDRILLQHPAASATLQASVNQQQWRVQGDLQLTGLSSPWQLELQLQSSGQWLLLLAEQSQLLLQQYGMVEQDADHTRLQLDQRLELAALSERLPQLTGLPLPLGQLQAKATLQLPNTGVLPRDLQLTSALTLTTVARPLTKNLHWQQGDWLLSVTKEQPDSDWLLHLQGMPQQIRLPAADLHLQTSQQLQGRCRAELNHCTLQGQLQQQLLNPAGVMLAHLQLEPDLLWQPDSLTLQLPLQAQLQQGQALVAELPLQQASLQGHLSASLDADGNWQLHSEQGLTSQLQLVAPPGWQLPPLALTLLPQLAAEGNLYATQAGEQLRVSPLRLQLQPVTLRQSATRHQAASELHLQASELQCQPSLTRRGLLGRCELSLALGPSSFQGWPIADVQLQGPLQWRQLDEQQLLTGQLKLQAAQQQLQLRLNLQHDVSAGRGNLQWHLNDTPLNWDSLNLSAMTALTKIQFLSGHLAGQGWVDWQQQQDSWQITPDISLRADNLSAIYDNSVALEGWNALLALRRPFQGDYLLDAQLSGLKLNPGIELSNLLARSQTRIPADFAWVQSEIYEMHTDVLGGRIHTPLIRYDSRREINSFGIEISRIQLSQIAALEPGSGVQASGTLDGLLPIVLTPQGPQIPAGNLFARDPGGVIRYQSPAADALGQSDQSVGLAMQILENFHYHQLQTGVQYQPDGQLNLALQFQGKNPDFFGGQSTHLNVNLEYNLLDFLESLRVTQDVITSLEEKYH